MQATIERASDQDTTALLELLHDHDLPVEGLLDHLATTLIARQDASVVGSAALEIYADGALLRSVAVARQQQGQGLGHELVSAALQLARDIGVPAVYLLTMTAERFFPKLGFERIERSDVPQTVQASAQFTSLCPASAIVMRKVL